MTLRVAALVASAAALVLAASSTASPARLAAAGQRADWPTYAFDVARSGTGPDGTGVSAAEAPRLAKRWRIRLDGVAIGSPILANGVLVDEDPTAIVYVGTEHGELAAVEAGSGRVVWRDRLGSVRTTCYDTPDDVFGISSTPVIDRDAGRLYVAASDGPSGHVWIHALDLATGREAPEWPVAVSADPWRMHVWGALTLWQGRLYVTMASLCDFQPSYGKVVSVDAGSARVLDTFHVVRDDDGSIVGGGGIWGFGGASVDAGTGDLFVATGNAFAPEPQDQPHAEEVVRLSPSLAVLDADQPALSGEDVDFGSTPLLFQAPGCVPQLAAENKVGALLIYDRDRIDDGPVQREQLAGNLSKHGLGIFIGLPAYDAARRTLFVSNPGPDAPPYRHGMTAFEVGSDCRLQLAWQAVDGPSGMGPSSTPTVVDGVVWWGDGADGRVFAVRALDGARLWDSGRSLPGAVFAPPVAADGMLFVVAWDGRVHAELAAFAP